MMSLLSFIRPVGSYGQSHRQECRRKNHQSAQSARWTPRRQRRGGTSRDSRPGLLKSRKRSFAEVIAAMPNVGKDSDFERVEDDTNVISEARKRGKANRG